MKQHYEIRADVTTSERDFRRAWYRVAWASSIEDEDRPLHISPFLGAYGRCGLVLAINGTPPAGLALWNAQTQRVYILSTLRVKTINVDFPRTKQEGAFIGAMLAVLRERGWVDEHNMLTDRQADEETQELYFRRVESNMAASIARGAMPK